MIIFKKQHHTQSAGNEQTFYKVKPLAFKKKHKQDE